MSGLLLLSYLLLITCVSLSESSSYRDLIKYTSRVNVLLGMLEAENCVHPLIKDLQRREILGTSDQHRYDIKVEVERRIYRQLEDILVECRSAAARKISSSSSQTTTKAQPASPDTTTSTTATPTTTTTTTPTITTTTAPKTTTTAITPTTTTTTTSATTTPTTTTVTFTTPVSSQATAPAPTECQSALNLTEGWRQDHKGSDIKPKNGGWNCDTQEMIESGRPWFRFSGDAGNHLMNKCLPYTSCGTYAPLWSDDTMPTQVGVITHVHAYGRWGDNCRALTKKMSVVRCSTSPHDYVYRYDGDDLCYVGFCGMTA